MRPAEGSDAMNPEPKRDREKRLRERLSPPKHAATGGFEFVPPAAETTEIWVVMGMDQDTRYAGPEGVYTNEHAAIIHAKAIDGRHYKSRLLDNYPKWIDEHLPDIVKEVESE
jgi:hypothetical protein